MYFTRPNTVIAKIKYVFGFMLAVVMLTSVISGNVTTTDKMQFKVVSDVTTESTSVSIEATNKSPFGINKQIYLVKLEKKAGDEWVEFYPERPYLNFPAFAYSYPYACIFPSETFEATYPCDYLFGQDTAPSGEYKLTFGYIIHKGGKRTTASCEFTVTQA